MGRAIEKGLRDQFITLKQQGASLAAISERLHLHYGTVCKLSAQFKRQGSLPVQYPNCGSKELQSPALVVRASGWLKRLHPSWGAPFIRLQLVCRYGEADFPQSRTLQRWFRKWGLNKPRQRLHQPRIGEAKAVHNIWQVDAKERFTLQDGTGACYLTITDEHSGAGLSALVFPPLLYLSGAGGAAQRKADRDL